MTASSPSLRRSDREMPNSEDFRRRYTQAEIDRAVLAVIADAYSTERAT